RKDGSRIWLEMRPTLVEWDQMPAIQVTYVDIDERKKAVEALRQSEEKFRNMVEGSIQGLVVFGKDEAVFANQAIADILGYDDPEDFLRIPSVDAYVHPEYRQRLRASREGRLRGEPVTTIREFKALRKDGSTTWLENWPTLVEWEGEIAMQSAYLDITERKKAEADAARAHQAKDNFLSLVSHELRTPLNAILGFGQLLRDYSDPPLTEDQKTNVGHILDGGQHLLTLVNEILDLSRIESGKLDLSMETVDPAEAVRESLAVMTPVADRRGIALHFHTDIPVETRIQADVSRLKQVLLNLLSNAVKYNRQQGTVETDLAITGNVMLRISVTDTGPGIATENRAEIFRPFSRLGADTSRIEGTGIGLSISRQLTESMGGAIGFDSVVGEGSTFWIEFPLAG
ncbi:MAG: ATP-binding protein, partial [Alphaproteobacteria bacterium]|nr:ATP-binding protein [Alphaproteobacteria bacterium]